jgi:hypothetical protein
MANEISLTIGGASGTGLTGLYVRALSGVTLGSPIALAEVSGAGGVYVGTMTGAAGDYVLLAYDSSDQLIGGSGQSYQWDGTEFTTEDAATIAEIAAHTTPLAAQLGLLPGISATHSPNGITVSAGPGSTVITDNADGSYTVEAAP